MITDLTIVVAASHLAASDYLNYNVYICSTTYKYKPTSHMAFYANGRIHRIIPALRGQVESIIFSEKAIEKRSEFDAKTCALLLYLIEQLSANNDYRYNDREYKVIFLSGKGDPDTIFLPHEIENNLVSKRTGKKIPFTYGHRYVHRERLLAAPKKTSDLLEAEAGAAHKSNTTTENQVIKLQPNTMQVEYNYSIQNPLNSDKTIEELLEAGYTGVNDEIAAETAFAAAAHKFRNKIKWTRTKSDEDGEIGLMTPNQEEFNQLLEFMLDKFGWCPMVYSLDSEPEIFIFSPKNKLEKGAIELTISGEYGWKGSLYSLEYCATEKDELCFIFSTKPMDAERQEWLLVKVNRSKNTKTWSVHDGILEQVYYLWAEQIGIPEPNFKPTTNDIIDALKDEEDNFGR